MTGTDTAAAWADLQPRSVWAHFATLCSIPRPSYREAVLRDYLQAWAAERGIASEVDAVGNLILRRAASPGCAAAPGVILQAHLDMVCQANAGTEHDFERDAIRAVVRDGWLVAEQTTLGADNGIGVALALAALEEPGLSHPPLEVLLTVNEESGMDGARGLAPGTLRGQRLINLDTEEWGHFYLGCAGGIDVEVRHSVALSAVPPGHVAVRLEVAGLRGGHSGIDIHLGRGNAIQLLAEAVQELSGLGEVRLIAMQGGTARNAIPREAVAVCALPVAAAGRVQECVSRIAADWQQRYAAHEAGVSLRSQPVELAADALALEPHQADRLLAFLRSVVNGRVRSSEDFPGVTDTSSNLGVLALDRGQLAVTCKVRSLHGARAHALADAMVAHAQAHGLSAWTDGEYPGWTPNPASPLLALCQQVYAAECGQMASLQVIHAGLECGLLAASHPHLDMISFGPDIRGAHAPGERVEIGSVAKCWSLLKAILSALAVRHGEFK
ncbi:beta-Ala-His dipeptidase [Ferriphaselus sp. R-1]|uniref:beta-Ala-His dipeptidase n=1 Tax=Ferriphaselus sp. R-1 TaxID=1485544 RepID=UPI0005540E54|nr:beta-Ala-His dipeptidase [Ferriphaselus sp. R-1]